MSDATRSQLEQAYRLIQQEDLDKAIAILKPIVAAQPNNIDAWWLLSNAVSEPADARSALQNVLRLDPNHNQARDLLDSLDREFPEYASPSFDSPAAPASFSMPPATASSTDDANFSADDLDKLLGERYPSEAKAATDDDGFPAENEDFDQLFGQTEAASAGDNPFDDPFASKEPGFVKGTDTKKKREPKVKAPKPPRQEKGPLDPLEVERRANSRTSPALLIGIILIIVIVIGGGVTLGFMSGLIGGSGGQQTATAAAPSEAATSIALAPSPATSESPSAAAPTTAPATAAAIPAAATSEAAAVAEVATSTTGSPLDSTVQAIKDSFAASKFNNAQASVVQSSLGDTLQVQFCSSAGPSIQTNLNKAMDLLAPQAVNVKDTVKAAGVLIVNCAKPDTMLVRAIAPIDAIATYVSGNLADKKTYRASWTKS